MLPLFNSLWPLNKATRSTGGSLLHKAYIVKDKDKTKEQLIRELEELRQQVTKLKSPETKHGRIEELLRESESKFRTVFENSGGAMFIVEPETGEVSDCNKQAEKLIGRRRDDIIGMHYLKAHPEDEAEKYKEKFNKYIKRGHYLDFEGEVQHMGGRRIPVLMGAQTVKIGGKNMVAGVLIDNSERKKAEMEKSSLLEKTQNALEELKKTQSYLLQSEKMASIWQLAAGVAHEINNPTGFVHSNLGSLNKYSNKVLELIKRYEEGSTALKNNGHKEILSFCEEMDELKKKLKMDFIMKDFKKVIADSLEGTQRIKKIVADLKNFSRVDQEELKPANINEGIESTLNVVWNELKYKCTVEKDFGKIPQLFCNLGQLNQVFMNLLVNAAYAIETKGTITISTRYLNEHSTGGNREQGYIEVKIGDTGRGIPEDKLKRIFEPFFTTKDVGKGTGLGLSIAYEIIQKHQGEITVQSEVGKGTIFAIKLPVLEEEQKEESREHSAKGSK